jgi:alcohol dehydrogenase
MRAVVYRGPGEVTLAEVSRPTLEDAADAIVKVTLAGLCGTDLHVIRGDFPGMAQGAVVGHEFVGEVVEAGSALQRIRVGDRVMSSDFTACGHCRWP